MSVCACVCGARVQSPKRIIFSFFFLNQKKEMCRRTIIYIQRNCKLIRHVTWCNHSIFQTVCYRKSSYELTGQKHADFRTSPFKGFLSEHKCTQITKNRVQVKFSNLKLFYTWELFAFNHSDAVNVG